MSSTMHDGIFSISTQVRYVAVCRDGQLSSRSRADTTAASGDESDKYEELLVNPTLLKLASQRGNIDCGGLEYIIIRYGNFFVLLTPCKNGHVNIGIEPDKNPFLFVEPLNGILRKYNMKMEKGESSL